MKIALYHNLPSGGAKNYTWFLIRELHRRGHQISEFYLDSADESWQSLSPFVDQQVAFPATRQQWMRRRLPLATPYIHAFQALQYQRELDRQAKSIAREIDSQDFDVVLVKDCQFTTIPFVLRHLKTPSVLYLHSLPLSRQRATAVPKAKSPIQTIKDAYYSPALSSHWRRARRIDEANLAAAGLIATNSEFSKNWLERHYEIKCRVVYPGVDVDVFSPIRCIEKSNIFLGVGALGSGKGYRFMIAVLGRMKEKKRPRLVIAANSIDPDEEKAVIELANKLNVHLEIRSVVGRDNMARLYNEAQVLLFTPYNEPFGLVVLEAMACGTPVVAVREGAAAEIIQDGYTGLLVERDAALFAARLESLLLDRQLIQTISNAAVEYVRQKWTWTQAADKLEHMLLEVQQ